MILLTPISLSAAIYIFKKGPKKTEQRVIAINISDPNQSSNLELGPPKISGNVCIELPRFLGQ